MSLLLFDLETYYDKDYTLKKLSTEEYINDERFEQVKSVLNEQNPGLSEIAHGPYVRAAKTFNGESEYFITYQGSHITFGMVYAAIKEINRERNKINRERNQEFYELSLEKAVRIVENTFAGKPVNIKRMNEIYQGWKKSNSVPNISGRFLSEKLFQKACFIVSEARTSECLKDVGVTFSDKFSDLREAKGK